jgi:hypothetical protein
MYMSCPLFEKSLSSNIRMNLVINLEMMRPQKITVANSDYFHTASPRTMADGKTAATATL